MHSTVIQLRVDAPPKPDAGAPCNGCGVCCAWQPCPLGILVSGSRRGPCVALRWDDPGARYRCAMVDAPHLAWPALGLLPVGLRPALQRWARRWIAAGAGCDCDAEARPVTPAG